ncbi:hypothetical protein OAO18_05195 [Francisellaceae bacterium]|nr:hypothetical protein [Francisellaceae bacterium]
MNFKYEHSGSSNNLNDSPSSNTNDTILMNAKLLILFSKIQNDLTHLMAIEIIQRRSVDEPHLAEKFDSNMFRIRRSIVELINLNLIIKSNGIYKVNRDFM